MSLAAAVVLAMFVLLIGLLGLILFATVRQLSGEVREAAERREL